MNQKGQLPAFFLLLIAVIGTLAVSMVGGSARFTEQGGEFSDVDRAFKAAEAGIEDALLKYTQGLPIANLECDGDPLTPAPDCPAFGEAGSQVKTVNVEESGVSGPYEVKNLDKDDVAQLALIDAGGSYSGDLTLYWTDTAGSTSQSSQSALILTEVYGTSPNYSINKVAVDCANRATAVGFVNTGIFNGSGYGGELSEAADYYCKYTYSVPSHSAQILRIRNLNPVAGSEINIIACPDLSGGVCTGSLPAQEVVITAVGGAGASESTEEVRIKKPALPAVFDFVLFSGSASDPITHE